MPMITHLNYKSSGDEIYCCLRNKVVKLDASQMEQFCNGCKMYGGDVDGQGVSCMWEDARDVFNPHIVHNPLAEFASNQARQVRPEGPSILFFGT